MRNNPVVPTRNKNIFIRKETEFSCNRGNGHPVFAHVTGYHQGSVHYQVDYPDFVRKDSVAWHYADYEQSSGIYVKPLEDFLQRFSPDIWNVYSEYTE